MEKSNEINDKESCKETDIGILKSMKRVWKWSQSSDTYPNA